MTRLASYEQREQRRNLKAGGFFRGDFISWELLKGFVCANLIFMILFGLVIFSQFDILLQEIYKMDLLEKGKEILGIYVVYLFIFMLGTLFAAIFRYNRARKSLKGYYKGLKELAVFYDGN